MKTFATAGETLVLIRSKREIKARCSKPWRGRGPKVGRLGVALRSQVRWRIWHWRGTGGQRFLAGGRCSANIRGVIAIPGGLAGIGVMAF